MDFDEDIIGLKVKGENLGWGAHAFLMKALVWRETGKDTYVWD